MHGMDNFEIVLFDWLFLCLVTIHVIELRTFPISAECVMAERHISTAC